MRVEVRVSKGVVIGYGLGLAGAVGVALLDASLAAAAVAVALCWAFYVPIGYWWGRSDATEESD
jgi:hypothetical protein